MRKSGSSRATGDSKKTGGRGTAGDSQEKRGGTEPSVQSFTPEEVVVVKLHAFIQPETWGFNEEDQVIVELRSEYLNWDENCAEVKLK